MVLCAHSVHVELRIRCNASREVATTSPTFSQQTAPITRPFCEGFTQHDFHILATAPFCCDRKVRAACAQSLALSQQATIEFTCRNHSIIACSHDIYMGLFFAHIPFVLNPAFSAMPAERLQQTQ